MTHDSKTDAIALALQFYADPKRYQGPNQRNDVDDPYSGNDPYLRDVCRDGGELARKALYAFRAPAQHSDADTGGLRAAVIEECAKVAEALHEKPGWSPHYKNASFAIAKLIRALTPTPAAGSAEQPCHGPDDAFCMVCNPPASALASANRGGGK